MKRPLFVTSTAIGMVLLLNGVALAYRLGAVNGSGTGAATSANGSAVLAITASSSTGLYPGGPAGSVTITVQNTYTRPITISAIAGGTPSVDSGHSTCTNPDITIQVPSSGLPLTVPASSTSAPTVLNGVVKMGTNAQSACQGATITIPFTVTGQL